MKTEKTKFKPITPEAYDGSSIDPYSIDEVGQQYTPAQIRSAKLQGMTPEAIYTTPPKSGMFTMDDEQRKFLKSRKREKISEKELLGLAAMFGDSEERGKEL